jgi:exopolysaccharide biosynthesis polyprenyl glycosylphosphotransferase
VSETLLTREIESGPFLGEAAPAASPQRRPEALRLVLTSRAPGVVRLHLARGVSRVGALLVADAATLLILRELLQGLRDGVWFGSAVAATLRQMAPQGALFSYQLACAVLLSLLIFQNYGSGDRRRDPFRLLGGAALGVMITLWWSLWTHPTALSIPVLAVLSLSVGVALVLERRVVDFIVRKLERRQMARALVVGPAGEALQIRSHPVFGTDRLFQISTFFDPGDRPLGLTEALTSLIQEHGIDTVILCGKLSHETFIETVDVAMASSCQVLSLPQMLPTPLFSPRVVRRNGTAFVELTRPSQLGAQLVLKRLIDLTVASAALVVLAPVMGAIAYAIRRDSQGPILFRQKRIGQGGREFEILKFRTMVADAEDRRNQLISLSVYSDGRLFKVPRDPRVTRLGKILRRTSMDELPQLWSVIRGDMTLVGPRPPLPGEVALYEAHHYARFDVKPGMTGPWQVRGRNRVTDFEEVVQLERAYIRNWNLGLDLTLLLKTIPVVVTGRGAH